MVVDLLLFFVLLLVAVLVAGAFALLVLGVDFLLLQRAMGNRVMCLVHVPLCTPFVVDDNVGADEK